MAADDTETLASQGATRRRRSGVRALERGEIVGRYLVVDRVGVGGMGMVYAAYDPELDRKLALKLLLPGYWEGRDGTRSRRLLREAQALAKLSHPNVVTIHDVGTFEDRVFIAMELLDGVTLSKWLKTERSWLEVLGVFEQAGRGLAAAHDKGLVHRDFKPDNVMVVGDGTVRVMDFGLARADGAEESGAEFGEDSGFTPQIAAFTESLTQQGSRAIGTPAYMAPEQHLNNGADARSDQFSFCVAMWEGLYGERPYDAESLHKLVLQVAAGKLRPPPKGRRVPGWLRAVCERGLQPDPDSRFASMPHVLAELGRGRKRRRIRWALAGAGALGATLVGSVGFFNVNNARRIAACETHGDRIEEVWNEDVRTRAREGLVATQTAYAEITAAKVMPWLDARAEEWRTHRTGACLAGTVEERWSEDTLARAQWCLEERRLELGALVARFVDADTEVVDMAVAAAAGLPSTSACLDESTLASLPSPPSPEARETIRQVRAQLAEAEFLGMAGKDAEALRLVKAARERAQGLGWLPVLAAARQLEGVLLGSTGSFAEAETVSTTAYMEATEARAWGVAAAAATSLVKLVGNRQARPGEGKVWGRQASVAASLAGGRSDLVEANRLSALASVHYLAGEYDDAIEVSERALMLREETLGPEHPHVAVTLSNLAVSVSETGALAEARALHERALEIRRETLGPEHPLIATSLNNLAIVLNDAGESTDAVGLHRQALAIRETALPPGHADIGSSLHNLAVALAATGAYDESVELHERGLAIRVRALGEEHPYVAISVGNLANVHLAAGRVDEAEALQKRALAVYEKTLGPEHRQVAIGLGNLASIYVARGEHERAKPLEERALGIRERTMGPEHPEVGASLHNLAEIHLHLDDHAKARKLQERALAVFEKGLGSEHPRVAHCLSQLAELELVSGDASRAVEFGGRAVAIFDAQPGVQEHEATARFRLARALIAANGNRDRALAEARRAVEGHRAAGEGRADDAAEVLGWIAEHRGS